MIFLQIGCYNAFLYRDIAEEVYMTLLPCFGTQGESRAYRLYKSLYDLKQASRQWFAKFFSSLFQHGFTQFKNDYSLFTRTYGSSFITLLVYVDNIIITSNDTDGISALKELQASQFELKDLDPLKYFMGFEVAQTTNGISTSHQKYSLAILTDMGFLGAKPVNFPIEQNLKFLILRLAF